MSISTTVAGVLYSQQEGMGKCDTIALFIDFRQSKWGIIKVVTTNLNYHPQYTTIYFEPPKDNIRGT